MNKLRSLKMLVMSLTGRCNFACRYCYASKHTKKDMSSDIAIRAVNLVAKDGRPFVLQLSGGEPFLSFELMQDIICYVLKRRIPAIIQVQTNASLFDREKVYFLKEFGVGVGISIDGRPAINDKQRCLPNGGGTSTEILKGVRLLAEAGLSIGITCVITGENVDKLSGVVEMAYYFGNVRRIGFDLLRKHGRGENMLLPSPEAIKKGIIEALETAVRLEKMTGRKIIISQLEKVRILSNKNLKDKFGHCYAMNGEAVFVDAEGKIYACSSLIGEKDFLLGDVWEGIDIQRQQAFISLVWEYMALCRICPYFYLCGGGCFARWYASYGCDRINEAECTLKRTCIQWFLEKEKR